MAKSQPKDPNNCILMMKCYSTFDELILSEISEESDREIEAGRLPIFSMKREPIFREFPLT